MTKVDGVGIFDEPRVSDPLRTAAATEVERDPHTGLTVLSGPVVSFSNGLDFHEFELRAWIDPRKDRSADLFAVLVRGEFDRRVYLGDAYARGEKLQTTKVDAERVCNGPCVTFETVSVEMDEAAVLAHAARGLAFRVTGRRENLIVRVPAGHFAGFHAAYAEERDGLRPSTSPCKICR